MTQEETQILLQDLCGRLPYGVKGIITYNGDKDIFTIKGISNILFLSDAECCHIEDFKPYLRPMSSMTEEEKKEYWQISEEYLDAWSTADSNLLKWELDAKASSKRATFYNSHHLDWNGLIPMGLALEALEGMYTIKEK